MDGFMTVPNFKRCEAAFARWMDEHYGVNVRGAATGIDFDKQMYATMGAVRAACAPGDSPSLDDLNNRALNALQKVYVDRLKLQRRGAGSGSGSGKPAFKPLDRDAQLFGDRPVTTAANSQLAAAFTRSPEDADLGRAFDMLLTSRKTAEPAAAPAQAFTPAKEQAIASDDFQQRLRELEAVRGAAGDLAPAVPPPAPAPTTDDPDYLLQSVRARAAGGGTSVADADPAQLYRAMQLPPQPAVPPPAEAYRHQAAEVLLPPPPPPADQALALQHTFFAINGFDRDWAAYPQRYRFAVDLTQLGGNYRNAAAIDFTSIVVPMEVGDARSLTHAVSKPVYHHDQRLAFPYLLLQVDELPGQYDGLNQQVRKSVAQFIYDTSYKCPNGRGYIVMRPAHRDAPAAAGCAARPVPSLQRMSLALVKPNGALFNASADAYRVVKVQYETYNAQYFQVVLDKYFDRNEFCLGDSVLVRDVAVVQPAAFSSSAPSPPPTSADFNQVTQFINRPEGHDVLQLGEANAGGFYNSFYVAAPMSLDQATGKLVVSKPQVDALREYNIAFPVSPSNPRPIGRLINASLQLTVSGCIATRVHHHGPGA